MNYFLDVALSTSRFTW